MHDSHGLGDHPTHGGSDQVELLDAQGVEQPDAVVGHVGDGVGRSPLEDHVGEPGYRCIYVGGEADVAVVVADHVVAGVGHRFTHLVPPRQHLGAESHDQQDRRIGLVPEGLVCDLDAFTVRTWSERPESLPRGGRVSASAS